MNAKRILAALGLVAALGLSGCYGATDAANEAREQCASHGGVRDLGYQWAFVHRYGWWTCKDGSVGAHDE